MKRVISVFIFASLLVSFARAQSRCLTPMFEPAKKALAEQYGGSHGPSDLTNDITSHEVGDTISFWCWDLTVMPPVWIRVLSTCRAVTENSYIFVADDQWNVHMDQADVDQVAYYWEEGTYNDSTGGIYQLNTENFGLPPDELDHDDHIYIFYSELGSFGGSVFDGYFSVFNEYTEEEAQGMGGHSNEVEMFYMSCQPGDPVSALRISVLAHEFEHMIHWAADPNEDSWVDEGCAEYAMLLFGVPDPLVDFPGNPDINLTVWNNQFADYIKTFMFFTYLSDHYGGAPMIQQIVQEPENSFYGVQAALDDMSYEVSFEEVFVNWTIANFYHGRGGADSPQPDSQYIYYSIDPPAFHVSDWHTTYPAGPNNRFVNNWAADYIVFGNPNGNFNRLSVDFANSSSNLFGLGIVQFDVDDNMNAEQLYPVTEDWSDEFDDFGQDQFVAMLVSAPEAQGNHNYSYQADVAVGIDSPAPTAQAFALGQPYPNPFNRTTAIKLSKPIGQMARLEVYDVAGRLVERWSIGESQDRAEILWSGENGRGKPVASGVYFFKLSSGEASQIARVTLLK